MRASTCTHAASQGSLVAMDDCEPQMHILHIIIRWMGCNSACLAPIQPFHQSNLPSIMGIAPRRFVLPCTLIQLRHSKDLTLNALGAQPTSQELNSDSASCLAAAVSSDRRF